MRTATGLKTSQKILILVRKNVAQKELHLDGAGVSMEQLGEGTLIATGNAVQYRTQGGGPENNLALNFFPMTMSRVFTQDKQVGKTSL